MLESQCRQFRAWLSDLNRRRLERRKLARQNRETPSYQEWINRHETPSAQQIAIWRACNGQDGQLLVSILVVTYNANLRHLEATISSALAQTYERWELCIADDASTDPEVRDFIAMLAAKDNRIKCVFSPKSDHAAAAANLALGLAKGEFIAQLEQGDLLAPHALSVMIDEIQRSSDAALVYSDDDKIDDQGLRNTPRFKPDWNHTLALSQNYVGPPMMIRRELVLKAGGFRAGVDGAQDYDLLLRCAELLKPGQIRHSPHILYHRREKQGNTAGSLDSNFHDRVIGCKVVQEHLQRLGRPAEVTFNGLNYRVAYKPPGVWPKVSVIVPTRDKPELLHKCLATVLPGTDYPSIELCIVDNGSRDPKALAWLAQAAKDPRVHVIRDDSPFNYSALNNLAVEQTNGEVICLMNNDIEVISPNWLKEMVTELLQPEVGIVGCRLYYPNRKLQHAGVIIGLNGSAGHIFRGQHRDDTHYMHRSMLTQELSAVTAACLVTRRDVFQNLGGLDTQYAVAFNDIDYCLRARKSGWKVVYHPLAELVHHESASRGHDRTKTQRERLENEKKLLISRHTEFIDHDPAYNSNLSKSNESAKISNNPITFQNTK